VVTITFEDSVITDTAEQKKLAMLEIDSGLLSKTEYRMRFYGESEIEATAKLESIEPAADIFHIPGENL
jgi:hypothetical protein